MPVDELTAPPQPTEPAPPEPSRGRLALRMLANAAHLYRLRVRAQPLQEVLAALGIAAGVALFFAVQVASSSISESWREISAGVSGRATIEIASRGPDGMDQQETIRAGQVTGVSTTAPVLERRVTVGGPAGRFPLTVVGVDERLEKLGGRVVERFAAKGHDIQSMGLFMTNSAAVEAGLAPGDPMTIEANGTVRKTMLAGVFTEADVGDLSDAPIAVAPLGLAQRLTGSQGMISRILVVPADASGLAVIRNDFGDRFDVRPIDTEVKLLGAALKPDRQSSALVSAIAMLVGLLFAYNAMLLAMAGRRRQVAELRLLGADRRTVAVTLAFEVFVLGVVASIAGVLFGDLLSRIAFRSVPEYISAGFAVGGQRTVGVPVVMISILGGLAATALAAALPAMQLLRVSPGEPDDQGRSRLRSASRHWRVITAGSGFITAIVATALAWLTPALTPIWVIIGLLGLLTMAIVLWIAVFERLTALARTRAGAAMNVAVLELNGAPVRAVALTSIAAVAMAAALGVGGARLDLQRGVDRLTSEYFRTSQLWVLPADPANVFQTQRFDPAVLQQRLQSDQSIASTSMSRWEFYDLAGLRLLMIVPPSTIQQPVVSSQLREGDLAEASKRIRRGGWIALSSAVAVRLHARVGQPVSIPTPNGQRTFKIAAITANHGWPSGSIVVSSRDYERDWHSRTTSTIGVDLAPGVSETAGAQAIRKLIRPGDAVIVRTPQAMIDSKTQAFVQGLSRLRQISAMVLGASILAIVAAMFAAVWQRRRRLAALRAIGLSRGDLGRSLLIEMLLVVTLGGLGGMIVGFYGQYLNSRWTAMATDYDAPFAAAAGYGFTTLAGMLLIAAVATLIPVYLATRISADIHEVRD